MLLKETKYNVEQGEYMLHNFAKNDFFFFACKTMIGDYNPLYLIQDVQNNQLCIQQYDTYSRLA
jgi:hypothetical protein